MNIHFTGIGGIGASALAKYYLSQGHNVSGSDLSSSEITEELKKSGAKIFIGKHAALNLPAGTKKSVYTAAASFTNPELREAQKRKIKISSYAEAVGELTKKYKTITISGAHGKSTTTALIALILREGYCDPTVIVGTKIKEFGNSNFRKGYGPYLVLEADEWNKSFLNYHPYLAVVTNIDAEHLDTYKTIEAVEETFTEYLSKVPRDGAIIVNADDPRLKKIAGKFGKKVTWYSTYDREAEFIRRIIRIPGEHNVSNALAALKTARLLGIHEPNIMRIFSCFNGCWRRFELKGYINGAYLFNDYGHHPREIKATINAARSRFPFRRIWCVYQPHQRQRLSYLWDDFITAFDHADRVCLLPVYDAAGRETISAKKKINSSRLAKELIFRGKDARHFFSLKKAREFITAEARTGDIILVMGAGDIYKLI